MEAIKTEPCSQSTPTTSMVAHHAIPAPTVATAALIGELLGDGQKLDGDEGEEACLVPTCAAMDDPKVADLVSNSEDFPAAFPDALAASVMHSCGVDGADEELIRCVSLMAQKCVGDIIIDAHQIARLKGIGIVKKGNKEPKFTLTHELLEEALREWGIDVTKPPYFQ